MKSYKLKKMKKGWFCGAFNPCAVLFEYGELAIKKMVKGKWIKSYYHANAEVVVCVLQGSVYYGKHNLHRGQCIYARQGEIISLYAEEDSKLLYVIYGDTSYCRNKFIDEDIIADTYDQLWPCEYDESVGEKYKDISIVIQGAVSKGFTSLAIKRI